MCNLTASDWIAFFSFITALASLIVAILSFIVARKTLQGAKEDWKQRKWFDLYFKADEAYNALEKFSIFYANHAHIGNQWVQDRNDVTFAIRQVHTMALVFPRNETIDALLNCSGMTGDPITAFDIHRTRWNDAIEGLRTKARIDTSVL